MWFEQAYKVAEKSHLAAATESLARTMKAEDGAIGRANAFLLSLRPAPEAKAAPSPAQGAPAKGAAGKAKP